MSSSPPARPAGDAPMAATLLENIAPGTTLIADRAYDTNAIRELATKRGAWANILHAQAFGGVQLRAALAGDGPAGGALLGHRRFATTEKHYVKANQLEASRSVNAVLAELRGELLRGDEICVAEGGAVGHGFGEPLEP